MKTVDIMETITNAIEKTIFKEWKHEGFIGGFSSEHINFEIDNKEYVLNIKEVDEERTLTIVSVRFNNKTNKTYDYEYKGKTPVQVGDTVTVDTDHQGKTDVEVVTVFTIKESEAEYDYKTAKRSDTK